MSMKKMIVPLHFMKKKSQGMSSTHMYVFVRSVKFHTCSKFPRYRKIADNLHLRFSLRVRTRQTLHLKGQQKSLCKRALKGECQKRSSKFLCKLCWNYKGALNDQQNNL